MNSLPKILSVTLLASLLLFVSPISFAKKNNIGVAAIVKDAHIIGKGAFETGDTLEEGDELRTGVKGNVTILLNDESMLMIGSNTRARFDVYEENNNRPGRSIIRIIQGSFRYFPGNILASGGSQFIAVGEKLLGKAASSNVKKDPTSDIAPTLILKNKAGAAQALNKNRTIREFPTIGTGGLSRFATNGLSGHVSEKSVQFTGEADVFNSTDSGLNFVGTAKAFKETSIVIGQESLPNEKDFPGVGIPPGLNVGITPELGGDLPPGLGGDIPPGLGGDIPPGLGGDLPPGLGGDLPPGLGGDFPGGGNGGGNPGNGNN